MSTHGFTRLLTHEQIVKELAAELEHKAPMSVAFYPHAMFQIAGLLQLALRHPSLGANVREAGEKFLIDIRQYFDGCPVVLDILTRGDTEDDQGLMS